MSNGSKFLIYLIFVLFLKEAGLVISDYWTFVQTLTGQEVFLDSVHYATKMVK